MTAVAAPVYDALGDPNRLRIVIRLCEGGPKSTSALSESITRQAAAKHLALLEDAGLVRSEKRGRERIWSVQTESLTAAADYLNTLSRTWDQRIEALRALVERDQD
ncbi:transcriptional regulator [Mycobacterium sp. ACS4331]|nr:transcriptional regulator [Mycobacterium sp. ACS4331]